MMKRLYIATIILASAAMPAAAQTSELRGTVNVDGRYLPDVIRQDRIHTRPTRINLSLDAQPLGYEFKGVNVDFAPSFADLPALGWQDTRKINDSKGYIDLMAGSWLDASLSAGYAFVDDRENLLGVRLQHNSTSLYKVKGAAPDALSVTRKLYDQTIGLYGAHRFAGIGTLSGSLDYRLGYFNYYGVECIAPADPAIEVKAPTQTLNNVRFGARFAPETKGRFSWHAGLGVDYFGYRALYLNDENAQRYRLHGQKEADFSLDGALKYAPADDSELSLSLRGDYLAYSNPDDIRFKADNYGNLRLTPAYRFKPTDLPLNINIGAEIDLTFGAGPKDDRFGTFHIAPAVKVDYKAGPVGIYLHALGGTTLNTLAWQQGLDYYAMPALMSTTPVYSPLDARVGFNFGSFSGFSAGVSLAYKITNHMPVGGWYTYTLNHALADIAKPTSTFYTNDYSLNIKGFSLEGYAEYRLGTLLKVRGQLSYQPQSGDKGYFNGLDRPRWIIDACATLTPVKPLDITLGYNYRGVRRAYAATRTDLGGQLEINDQEIVSGFTSQHLPDITNPYVAVTWRATDRFSLTLRADNLLGHKVDILPGLLSQGFTLGGGIQMVF